MLKLGTCLLVLTGLGLVGCASARIVPRSGPALESAPRSAPRRRTARVGERVPLSEMIQCETTPPIWRMPRREALVLTAEEAAGGALPCCCEGEEEEEPLLRHKLSLFLGYTSERGDETGGTFGLDYLYRFNRNWGIGAFFEHVGGDFEAWAGGVGVDYHPNEEIFLFAGPGFEYVTTDEDGERLRGLLRLGAGYDIELGRGWSIAPVAYVDFIDVRFENTPALILGVNIGKAWGR